jgi:hypothetical protein
MSTRRSPGWRRFAVVVVLALAGAPGAPASEEGVGSRPHAGGLGTTLEELRAEFGDALRVAELEPSRAPAEQILGSHERTVEPGASADPVPEQWDPFTEQIRLVREGRSEDVRQVEYELFRSRVYRIRWRLSDRFERPLMGALVARLRERLGKPYYDQQIEGKFASGRATLRRAAWRRADRSLEVRQLHPQNGGPLYLTLSDPIAIRAIVASRGTVAPEPESSGPWWQEPQKSPGILTPGERDTLLRAVEALLGPIGF